MVQVVYCKNFITNILMSIKILRYEIFFCYTVCSHTDYKQDLHLPDPGIRREVTY